MQERERSLEQLMRQAQSGDQVAMELLLTASYGILRPYVRAIMRRLGMADESVLDDILQEILIAVHAQRHTFDPERPFMPWLTGIAKFKTVDSWRRRKKQRDRQVTLDSIPEPADQHELEDAAFDLGPLLEELSPQVREGLKLVKLDGLSYGEAAMKLGLAEGALRVSVHRALKQLRGLLQKGATS